MANQVSSSAATFLVDAEVWRDELEIVAGRDLDDGAADALHAAVTLVALLGGAEEQGAVLVHPDVAVA
jgi:hypothetical protein